MTTQTGPFNPAATRYVAARQALLDALETMAGAVAGGYAIDNPQTLHSLWEEYRGARSAIRGPSRVRSTG